MDLRGRDCLKLIDFSKEEVRELTGLAGRLKAEKRQGILHGSCVHNSSFPGKNIALIFEKESSVSRAAFSVAASDLLMGSDYFAPNERSEIEAEQKENTAAILSRMYDGIVYLAEDQEEAEDFARSSEVPVWNASTNSYHPMQMIADLLTMEEALGELRGKKLAFLGDGRHNTAGSYMMAAAKMGMHFTLAAPEEYFPSVELQKIALEIAEENGGSVRMTERRDDALKDASVLCTDAWLSEEDPEEIWQKKIYELSPYQINEDAFARASGDAILLSTKRTFYRRSKPMEEKLLRDYGIGALEVSREVSRRFREMILREAENQVPAAKALMYASLGGQ